MKLSLKIPEMVYLRMTIKNGTTRVLIIFGIVNMEQLLNPVESLFN